MAVQITVHAYPGQRFLDIINDAVNTGHGEGLEDEVQNIVITFDSLLNGKTGAFLPDEKTIIIDIGHCITNHYWLDRGATSIANAWFNMIYTLFHELKHARQLSERPELVQMAHLTDEYETDAREYGFLSLEEWSINDGVIPELDELGVAGETLKESLNQLYASATEEVDIELSAQGTNLAGYMAKTATTLVENGEMSVEEVHAAFIDMAVNSLGNQNMITSEQFVNLRCLANAS